ncbi:Dyp-type peroxidase [uncultured Amnibacterium sp.]|uniref:Dyp-type peroxidase n=1 Tax=uncultured Amnibacterium sp. TaxID=1631851 RepID=UPI0035CC93A6
MADPASTPLQANANIQGNVLAGFNKDQQVLLFVSFPTADIEREWLKGLLPRIAHNDQVAGFNVRFSARRRQSGSDPADMLAVWTNVSFTAAGIAQLDEAAVDSIRSRTALDAGLQHWLDGAAHPDVLAAVGDDGPANTPDNWLFGHDSDQIHAVVCVAADRVQDLDLELARHRESAATLGYRIVFEQSGATLPGAAAGHEHFGFKDGISQPGVTGFDESDPVHTEQVKGKLGTDLVAPGDFVLGYQRDPLNGADAPVVVPRWMWDGSFLVTRRLAQDVAGFWSNVEEQYKTLPEGALRNDPGTGIPSSDAFAARLVGRWRSGTPTDREPVADVRSAQDPAHDNDFDFAGDPNGDTTPAVAHIRKVYPRSGAAKAPITVTEDDTKVHRIIRRGIPYGLPFAPTGGRGEGVDAERGLLFQCYQASLHDQFVFLQQAWVNNPGFPAPDTGDDPVIGKDSDITIRGGGQTATAHFAQWVHTRGSLFSFTPSIATLTSLAVGTPLSDV